MDTTVPLLFSYKNHAGLSISMKMTSHRHYRLHEYNMAEETTRRLLGCHRKRERLNKKVSESSDLTGHNRFRTFPTS